MLTNGPLPEEGGCCHDNIQPVRGPQLVTKAMISLLEILPDETIAEALEYRNVRYQLGAHGAIFVDPDELPLPMTYGRGTDHLADESFDWSGWYEQWETNDVEL